MATPQEAGHPRIVVRVGTRPGRYRRKADLTGPGGTDQALPADAASVIVQVGAGLRPEDLPAAIATARKVRGADVVEIIGSTRQACERARTVFLDTWAADDDPDAVGARAALWAAQFLASGEGEGSAR
jgi:hypothetical protein